jgi:hypothetical protein
MRGSILKINLRDECGDVTGEDGLVRSFSRDAMVRWLEFLELSPGDPVTYDVEHTGAVINLERVSSPPGSQKRRRNPL